MIVKPSKPFYEWVNSVFPDSPVGEKDFGVHDNSNVYFIPSLDSVEDALEFLKENFDYFFAEELYGWCKDDSLWPQKRDWAMFELWFDYTIQSVVLDTLPQPIVKEEFRVYSNR